MEGEEAFEAYVRQFLVEQFPKGDIPIWVVEALAAGDIYIKTTLTKDDTNAGIEKLEKKRPLELENDS
jgi:hypothetical protein